MASVPRFRARRSWLPRFEQSRWHVVRSYRPSLEQLEAREVPSGTGFVTPQSAENLGALPVSFEPNVGQADPRFDFLARGPGYAMFLTAAESLLLLQAPPSLGKDGSAEFSGGAAVVGMRLVGASDTPMPNGYDMLPGKANYFTSDDPSAWRTGIPTYGKVAYQDVYPGIDLVYYGNQQELEYDFVVAPGADGEAITWAFEGINGMELDAAGNLILHTAVGDLLQHAPILYQGSADDRQAVSGRFVMRGPNRIGFDVGAYDRNQPLTIDPVLSYSTYLGGSGQENGSHIAVDSTGSIYIVGQTLSTDFPTMNPFQMLSGGLTDTVVAKMNAAGTALVFSTYLGGSANDIGRGIDLDASGNVYVTGSTASNNFPTKNPFQAARAGSDDAFVTKLDATGMALLYSTYLGGAGQDTGFAIAVDDSGSAHVTGSTASTDFPTKNPLQGTSGGGQLDAFVATLDPAGTALVYSTYLGGSGIDIARGIAVSADGATFVTGSTASTDFPMMNPLQPAHGGAARDAFVSKLNAAGTALTYSTYLGGRGEDEGHGIAVDAAGSAFVVGTTSSTNFPIKNAVQPSYGGDGSVSHGDAFVSKMNAAGTELTYSTFLGGSDGEIGRGIAVDLTGSAYVTGSTLSANFPTKNAVQPVYGGTGGLFDEGGDVFVTKLSASGTALIYSTFLGGSSDDFGRGIAVDHTGFAYVVGQTFSTDFPTKNALQPSSGGGVSDAFIVKLIGRATRLDVAAPANAIVGTPFTITVTALDGTNTLFANYTGTIHFTSTDPLAILPPDYTFTWMDAGIHTFTVTLNTVGGQIIAVADIDRVPVTGSATVIVNAPVSRSVGQRLKRIKAGPFLGYTSDVRPFVREIQFANAGQSRTESPAKSDRAYSAGQAARDRSAPRMVRGHAVRGASGLAIDLFDLRLPDAGIAGE